MFRSKDFTRGEQWETHYRTDADVFGNTESQDGRPAHSSYEIVKEYAERKARLVLEKDP